MDLAFGTGGPYAQHKVHWFGGFLALGLVVSWVIAWIVALIVADKRNAAGGSVSGSRFDDLKKLGELRDSGIISAQEFET